MLRASRGKHTAAIVIEPRPGEGASVHILGIDIGGTGIKSAPVDTPTGTLLEERYRILTPAPATPEAVSTAVAQVATHFAWRGPIGCGFPAIIRRGQVRTAVHVDKAWLGRNAPTLLSEATGCPVTVLNDADAAGYAEMRFGAGQSQHGVVLLVTLGTGIGSALFVDGHLVPNTELGHIEVRGQDAEWFCQVVEAETLIRRVSAPRLSSQPFRRPAPCS